MVKVKFVDLPLQYKKDQTKIVKFLKIILNKGDFVLGSAVEEFEKEISKYCGTKYALGLNSGTDALFLAMKAYDIGHGDEVITVSNTFIATVGAIVACGAKPVFVDISIDSLIDVSKIEKVITKNTKAIIPVHLFGRICEMNEINKIAKKYNLKVIEDAAQAIGSEYYSKKAGNLGDIGCFSLHPLKIFNVLGDGGFLTTNDQSVYEKIKCLRNHGLKNRNEFDFFGYNSRLDTFHALTALDKLNDLDKIINKKILLSNIYRSKLKNIKQIKLPLLSSNRKDNENIFMIQAENRDELLKYLEKNEIEAKIHYPIPIHLQKGAEYLKYNLGSLPETERQSSMILSLPIHQDLTKKQILWVTESISNFYNNNNNNNNNNAV